MRVNFLSNHWLCSAILLATTNWARYKEKEKDKERKLRKLHCTNSCFFAKIDIFKLFAVHVSFILSLGTGTYGDVGPTSFGTHSEILLENNLNWKLSKLKVIRLKVVKIEMPNWKLPKLKLPKLKVAKIARIENCYDFKLPKVKIAKIENC